MGGSIISLSKITYQMWCDNPFSQRNKTKRAVVMEVGGDEARERVKKILKRG